MRKTLINGLLFCVSLVLACVIADGLFQVYETRALGTEYGLAGDTIYLAKQNYNETHIAKKKAANEFRILSFGDSFAYTITKYPYSYHGVAASLLNTVSSTNSALKVRIVNLGEPAISFPQYIRAYEHWVALIEHDAVIFNIYLGNDIIEVTHDHIAPNNSLNGIFGGYAFNVQTGKPRDVIPRKYPFRSWDYVYAYYRTWMGDMQTPLDTGKGKYNLALRNLSDETYYYTLALQMENFSPQKLGGLRKGYQSLIQLAKLAATIRQSGKQVLILLSPSEAQVTPTLQQALAKRLDIDLAAYDFQLPAYLAREVFRLIDFEMPILDLSPSFDCATAQGQDLFYGTDTHCSAEGNELAGRNLAYFIATHWLQETIDPAQLPQAACVGPEYIADRTAEMTPTSVPGNTGIHCAMVSKKLDGVSVLRFQVPSPSGRGRKSVSLTRPLKSMPHVRPRSVRSSPSQPTGQKRSLAQRPCPDTP
jgi:hypothetical protein